MNHYTKSIWALAISLTALALAFMSPLFGVILGIVGIVFGKRTMSEAKSKLAYAGFWLGIAAVAIAVAICAVNIIYFM